MEIRGTGQNWDEGTKPESIRTSSASAESRQPEVLVPLRVLGSLLLRLPVPRREQ